MESRKHLAEAKKANGTHNCTQAVCCTYYDYSGLDEETIKHAGNCFAAGMGNMQGTCGALGWCRHSVWTCCERSC